MGIPSIIMANEHALTVSLEEFGLSKYEAQAYVTLISKGTISAAELAYYSEIPRTKAYPVLLKLEKKKLVIISKTKPIMCTAVAPEDAFDEVIHEQINKINAMNTLVSNLKKVSEDSKKSRGSEERRYFHIGANNVLSQLHATIDGTKSSLLVTADQWGLGLLAECKEGILAALRRNVDVKIIIPSNQIGSETCKTIPNGVKMRISDIVENCIISDQTELMIIDSNNGRCAIFSSTEVLGSNETKVFLNLWKVASKVDCLADMTKNEAQEIYKIIRIMDELGLGHVLNAALIKKNEIDFLKLLEENGVDLKERTVGDVMEIIDAALQITCSGHASYDEKIKNIEIESKLNSGHSLPWVALLDTFLQKHGLKTRMIYQSRPQKGEKIHIKIM